MTISGDEINHVLIHSKAKFLFNNLWTEQNSITIYKVI